MGVVYGRALIQPATLNTDLREVDVVFITETLVPRFGWTEDYDELLVCEQAAIRMDRANRGLPVLDCHRTDSVFNQIGRSVKVWIDDQKQLCARIRFSQRKEVAGLLQDIADGIVKDISGGYEIYKYEREERLNGQRPIYRAVDWMPTEISLAPVQADIKSEIRGLPGHPVEIVTKRTINTNSMKKARTTEPGKTMDYTVTDNPLKTGDIVTFDDGTKGVALSDGEVGDTITLAVTADPDADPTEPTANTDTEPSADGGTASDANAAPDTANEPDADDDKDPDSNDAEAKAKANRQRVASIQQMTRAAGLPDAYALTLVASAMTLDQCSRAIMRRMAQRNGGPHGTHAVNVGLDAGTKKRMAAENALLHRIYPKKFALDNGAREFRGMTLVEIGRELLAERGIHTRGMDRTEVANAFFKRSASTSDFPLLFEGVIHKMLRAQYEFAPEYWDKIARQTSVDDFRAKGLYSAGIVNGMKKIAEGAEIKYTQLKESRETIRVESFAEGIRFTRQAFINDDLGVFTIIPSAFVRHWNTTRGNLVWGLITDNVKMSDNKALFHSDHNNLIAGAATALNEASLAAAKTALSKQKDNAGELIRVLPRFLVVPPELEMMAKKLVTATTPAKSEDVNVFAGEFDVIVEPRLTDPNAWYLLGDPYAMDSLYYAYLEGNEALRVDSSEEFKTDSMDYAVRGDFGAAAIDYRGIVKATGK